MLLYPGSLPPGALVRADPPASAAPAPVWLTADPDRYTLAGDRVVGWRSQDGHEAIAVAANVTGTAPSPTALCFEAEVNGGLLLADAIPDGATLTLGLIFAADPPGARSLLALQQRGDDSYLFLSADGGRLRLGQKVGDADLSLPGTEGVTLLLCALSGGRARLAANGGPAEVCALSLPNRPADLFLGCRGGRGLKGKLGSFRLSDVLIWPGQDLLADPGPALQGALDLWQERRQRGI